MSRLIRIAALLILLITVMQIGVCLADSHCMELPSGRPVAHTRTTCDCNGCGCCSLYLGFPPLFAARALFLIERLPSYLFVYPPRQISLNIDHPPRS